MMRFCVILEVDVADDAAAVGLLLGALAAAKARFGVRAEVIQLLDAEGEAAAETEGVVGPAVKEG